MEATFVVSEPDEPAVSFAPSEDASVVVTAFLALSLVSTAQLTPTGFLASVSFGSEHMLLFCGVGHPGRGWSFLPFQMLDSTQIVRLFGLPLSESESSSHCLVTFSVVVSGVCLFVTWKSFSFSEEPVGVNTHPVRCSAAFASEPFVPSASVEHPLVV